MRRRCWKGQSFSYLSTDLQANEATKHYYWLSLGARGCYPKTFHGSKHLEFWRYELILEKQTNWIYFG